MVKEYNYNIKNQCKMDNNFQKKELLMALFYLVNLNNAICFDSPNKALNICTSCI